jgi:hypothetical protein
MASPTFRLLWTEKRESPVHAPDRKGFGSAILLDLARLEGSSEITVQFFIALSLESPVWYGPEGSPAAF